MMFAFCFIGVCALNGSLIKRPGLFVFLIRARFVELKTGSGKQEGKNEKDMQNCVKE